MSCLLHKKSLVYPTYSTQKINRFTSRTKKMSTIYFFESYGLEIKRNICNKIVCLGDKLKKPFSSDTENLLKVYGTKPTMFGWVAAILWRVYGSCGQY